MEAKGDKVHFLATDLEVGLRSECDASVSKPGKITLPAKKLYEIVKSLPETDIRISEDKSGVKVAADRFESRMQTLPCEDFPTLPAGGVAPTAVLAASRSQGDDREDAVCDHRRGHAVFSERRALRAPPRFHEPCGDRRPSPGARHRQARRQGAKGRRRDQSDSAEENAGRARQSFSPKARATSPTSAARTTCSSRWAAACSSRA